MKGWDAEDWAGPLPYVIYVEAFPGKGRTRKVRLSKLIRVDRVLRASNVNRVLASATPRALRA